MIFDLHPHQEQPWPGCAPHCLADIAARWCRRRPGQARRCSPRQSSTGRWPRANGCCSWFRSSAWSTRPSLHSPRRASPASASYRRSSPLTDAGSASPGCLVADAAAAPPAAGGHRHHRRGAPLVPLPRRVDEHAGLAARAVRRAVGDALDQRAGQALRRPDRGCDDGGADRQGLPLAVPRLCSGAPRPLRRSGSSPATSMRDNSPTR